MHSQTLSTKLATRATRCCGPCSLCTRLSSSWAQGTPVAATAWRRRQRQPELGSSCGTLPPSPRSATPAASRKATASAKEARRPRRLATAAGSGTSWSARRALRSQMTVATARAAAGRQTTARTTLKAARRRVGSAKASTRRTARRPTHSSAARSRCLAPAQPPAVHLSCVDVISSCVGSTSTHIPSPTCPRDISRPQVHGTHGAEKYYLTEVCPSAHPCNRCKEQKLQRCAAWSPLAVDLCGTTWALVFEKSRSEAHGTVTISCYPGDAPSAAGQAAAEGAGLAGEGTDEDDGQCFSKMEGDRAAHGALPHRALHLPVPAVRC